MQIYFFLLGIVLLGAGSWSAFCRLQIALRGVNAEAWAVGPSVNEVEGQAYTATRVRYRVRAGNEVEFTHYAGTTSSLPAGTPLAVRYLPGRPGRQVVRSWAGYLLAPGVILALAGVCLWLAMR